MRRFASTLLAASLLFGGCASAPDPDFGVPAADSYRPFDASRDAAADVAAALARVAGTERRVAVVLGANWCHDSRGLAEHFARPEIAPLIAKRFEVVWVDTGMRDRNKALAERFGVAPIQGTPTLVVLDARGRVLNREDAPSWRDAHSRTGDEVRAELVTLSEASGAE